MFHLYSINGFESAHRTLAAAKRAADRAVKHTTGLRVVECPAGGQTTGEEATVYEPARKG